MNQKTEAMGLLPSTLLFGGGALLLLLQTRVTIPLLSRITGLEPVLFWFLVGGLGVFLPLIAAGALVLRAEGRGFSRETFRERLRFKPLVRRDWLYVLGGIVAVGIGSMLIMALLTALTGPLDHSPPFMSFDPLGPGRYWILAAWLPYWLLNILGEEFLWRGVMLPRQELAWGRRAWFFHALGWGVFHIAFGWQLLLTLLPIIFIQSWVVQKTGNSWTGVIIHGGLNGPSFIAIALGLL